MERSKQAFIKPGILRWVVAIVMIVINVYWGYHSLHLYYLYHYSSMLFVMMLPDWVLFAEVFFAALGIIAAIYLLRMKLQNRQAVFIQLGIIICWFVLELGPSSF